MANSLAEHTVQDVVLVFDDFDSDSLLVAQQMIEKYCDVKFLIKEVWARYTVDTDDGQLSAVEDYPINHVVSVTNAHNQTQTYFNNDLAVFPNDPWSGNEIQVRYWGGMPMQVFNAVMRQAKVLESRPNIAPEILGADVPIDVKLNASMRSGLSPDVKQMVFPYKVIGF